MNPQLLFPENAHLVIWSKIWIFDMKTPTKLIIRVIYFLQIRVGLILHISKIPKSFFQNIFFEQTLDFLHSVLVKNATEIGLESRLRV